MREVSKMPTEGQFVIIWEYNGLPWSDTVKWEDGGLLIYDHEDDDFIHHSYDSSNVWSKGRYFIV